MERRPQRRKKVRVSETRAERAEREARRRVGERRAGRVVWRVERRRRSV